MSKRVANTWRSWRPVLRRRGIAIITTLLMLTIMLMMLMATLLHTFGESWLGRGAYSTSSAHYAAESGLALAMSRLASNSAFSTTTSGTLSNQSSYTIDFGPGKSVNNLASSAAANGPRGAGTVAPHSCYLVIYGRHGSRVRRLDAVVTPGLPRMSTHSAIRASGNITLMGNVQVDGVVSLEDGTPLSADLVSNSASNQTGVVRWVPNGGAANIDGAIRTVSSLGSSIQATGANVSQGLMPGSAARSLPHPNIQARVSAHSSDPVLTTSPGVTSLGAGNRYLAGDLNYVGDLELNDTNLYVNGSVNVTGAIRGKGSLFVVGNTSLHGDAQVQAAAGEQVSLLSHGSVTLQGYDGSDYLKSLDASAYSSLQSNLQILENSLRTGNASPYINGGTFDNLPVTAIRDSVNTLRTALSAEPASPRKDFLMKRLDLLSTSSNDGMFDWPLGGDSGPGVKPQDAILDAFLADGKVHGGVFDAFNDRLLQRPVSQQVAIMNRMLQLFGSLDYRSPGSASFVGQVYSNGYVFTQNDLNVLGSLQTLDDGTQLAGTPDGSTTVRPGELFLSNTTRVRFVQSQSDAFGSSAGTMDLKMVFEE